MRNKDTTSLKKGLPILAKIFNRLKNLGRIKGGVDLAGAEVIFNQMHDLANNEAYKSEKAAQENILQLMLEHVGEEEASHYREGNNTIQQSYGGSSWHNSDHGNGGDSTGGGGNNNNNNGGGNTGGGGGGGGNNNGGGRMSPRDYLPGRLTSQFNYRAENNCSFYDRSGSDIYPFPFSGYYIGTETIHFNGGCIVIGYGTIGAMYTTYYYSNDGDTKRINHTTYHIAGNYHVHPDEKDKSKDYYVNPKRWYGKDSLLGKVVDKGDGNAFKKGEKSKK